MQLAAVFHVRVFFNRNSLPKPNSKCTERQVQLHLTIASAHTVTNSGACRIPKWERFKISLKPRLN